MTMMAPTRVRPVKTPTVRLYGDPPRGRTRGHLHAVRFLERQRRETRRSTRRVGSDQHLLRTPHPPVGLVDHHRRDDEATPASMAEHSVTQR